MELAFKHKGRIRSKTGKRITSVAIENQSSDIPIIILMDHSIYLDSLSSRADVIRASSIDEVAQISIRRTPWLTIISGDTNEGRKLISKLKRHPSTRTFNLVAVETPLSPNQSQPSSRTQADHHVLRSSLVEFLNDQINILTSNVPLPEWMREKLKRMILQHRQQQAQITSLNQELAFKQDHIDQLQQQILLTQTELKQAGNLVKTAYQAKEIARYDSEAAKAEALRASTQYEALSDTLKLEDGEQTSAILLQAEVEALKMEMASLRFERDSFQTEITEFETKQDEWIAKITALEVSQGQWEIDRQRIQDERNQYIQDIDALKKEIAGLPSEEEVQQRIFEIQNELANMMEAKDQAILDKNDAKQRLIDALQRADVSEDLAHKARQEREQAISERREMEEQVEQSKKHLKAAEDLGNLQNAFDSLSTDAKAFQQQVLDLEQVLLEKSNLIDSLKIKYQETDDTIEQLEQLRMVLQREVTELNRQVEAQRIDLSALEISKEEESETNRTKQNMLQTQLGETETKLGASLEEFDRIQKIVQEQEEEHNSFIQQLQEAETQSKVLLAEIEAVQTIVQSRDNQISQLETDLKKASKNNKKTQKKLEESDALGEEALEHIEALEKEVETLKEENQDSQQELHTLREEREQKDILVTSTQAELNLYRQEAQQMIDELNDKLNTEVKNNREKTKRLEKELESLQSTNEQSSLHIQTLSATQLTLETEKQKLQEQIEQLESAQFESREALKTAHDELIALNETIDQKHATIRILEEQNTGHIEQLEAAKATEKSRLEQIEASQNEIQSYESSLSDKQEAIDTLQQSQQLKDQELSQLLSDKQEAIENQSVLNEKINVQEGLIRQSHDDIQALKSEALTTHEHNTALKTSIAGLQQQLNIAEEEREKAQTESNESATVIQYNRRQLQTLEATVEESESAMSVLQNQVNSLKAKLQSIDTDKKASQIMNAEVEQLREQLKRSEAEKSIAQAAAQTAAEQEVQIRSALRNAQNELSTFQSEHGYGSDPASQIDELRSENARLRSEIESNIASLEHPNLMPDNLQLASILNERHRSLIHEDNHRWTNARSSVLGSVRSMAGHLESIKNTEDSELIQLRNSLRTMLRDLQSVLQAGKDLIQHQEDLVAQSDLEIKKRRNH